MVALKPARIPAATPDPAPINGEPDDVQVDGSHYEPGADDAELDLIHGPVPKP